MSDAEREVRTDQLKDLLATVEQIRATKYPSVPEGLVKQILLHHSDAAASETNLLREVEKLVDDHMAAGD